MGKPLIVYHGTPKASAGFEVFKGANKFYFSSKNNYAKVFAEDFGFNDGFEGQVYKRIFINAKPLDLTKTKNKT